MRNLLLTLLLGLSVISYSQTYLLQEDFENGYSDWTAATNSGNGWSVFNEPLYAHSGNISTGYQYSATENADSYFFFSALYLDAGTTYDVSFWQKNYSSTYTEKFELTIGATNTIAAQSTVQDYGSATNNTYIERTATYTPTTSGIYYFAIHCYSDANQEVMFIDDISVSTSTCKDHSCSAATSIAALPYNASSLTTCGNCNNYSSTDACGSIFMNGSEYVFTYTPSADGWVDVQLNTAHDGLRNGAAVFLLDNCPSGASNCLASSTVQYPAGHGSPHVVFEMTAGQTYYIVVANDPLTTFNTHGCLYFDIDVTDISHPMPTEEDCFGSQPICGATWHEDTPGNGQGGFPSEVNSSTSCLEGERNGNWYSFTVEASGTIQVLIDPDYAGTSGDVNDNADDYDFALYNVTPAGCEGLFDGSSPQVACNYIQVLDGEDGNTGVNSTLSGSNPSFEDDVDVIAGETYMLYISQWSVSTNGFTITLGGTADFIDDVGPELTTVDQPLCGDTTVTVYFSEAIDCSAIAPTDFIFTNPGGLTVTAASSPVCDAGGSFTGEVVLTLSAGIEDAGTYTIGLVDGAIADVCGHTNPVGSPTVDFSIVTPLPSITGDSPVCAYDLGSTYTTTNNTGNTYLWTTTSGAISGSSTNNSVSINWADSIPTTVTVTETITATGCSFSNDYSVIINTLPTVTAVSDDADDAICAGESITLTGGGADSYTWDNAVNDGSAFIPTVTQTYTVIGENSTTGCENTAQITITVNSLPTVYAGADQSITVGSSTVINDATAGLTTYAWTPSDSLVDATIQNPTTEMLYLTNTFTLIGTDANGCVNSDDITITVTGGPLSVSLNAIPNDSICSGDSATIVASASGASGIYTYNWSSNPVGTYPSTSSINVSPNVQTEYYIHVVDGVNNAYDTITVTVNSLPIISGVSVSDLQCNGDNSGEINISATGTGSLSYSINNGVDYHTNNGLFSSMGIGTGFITVVEDEFGCVAYGDTVDISQPVILSVNVSALNHATCGAANGDIALTSSGGTSPYNYVWYSGQTPTTDPTYSNIAEGNYSVTVTDSHGCDDIVNYSIDNFGGGIVDVTLVSDIDCFNNNNGEMTAVITNGTPSFTYYLVLGLDTLLSHTTIDSFLVLDTLAAGNYSIITREGVGCESVDTFVITEPTQLLLTDSVIKVMCSGESNGEIYITAYGGTPDFTYLWSNSETNSYITNLNPGNYSVTVTDYNGCTSIFDTMLVAPTQMLISDSIYYQNHYGNIKINTIGGTPEYTYLWSNGVIEPVNTNLISGGYFVTVTDANNCSLVNYYKIDIDLIIPTVITPNADGKNDRFRITNVESLENIKINIFNRWGDLVYTFDGNGYAYPTKEWNGNDLNGNKLPIGSYVCVIEVDSQMYTYKGTVTIVR